MVSPAVIMGAIFNVSLDLIGLYKIELLKKICKIFANKFADFWKNSRIFENFVGKHFLTRQKICSFVNLGKMLPRQVVSSQIVTRQNVAEPHLWIIDADRPTYLAWKRFTKQSAACSCIFSNNQSIEV